MASAERCYSYEGTKSIIIVSWKVKPGQWIGYNSVILSYHFADDRNILQRLKANIGGIVKQLQVKVGDIIAPGFPLFKYQVCDHEVVMKDICAQCGSDLRQLDSAKLAKVAASTSISMVHSVPELRVSHELAQQLGQADEDRLLKLKKLVLLVDLDQTLIHTTNDSIPANLKDVFHFQLYGHRSPWYHTRLRPGTRQFLDAVSKYYELHICTFGARAYAHKIAQFLDPDGKLFSHRILSRDECFNATSKTGNLKFLFPCGDSMVCIIDDREDVWNFAPNVVHVKPYHFFHNTGDINAPPGMEKTGESSIFPDDGEEVASGKKIKEDPVEEDKKLVEENKNHVEEEEKHIKEDKEHVKKDKEHVKEDKEHVKEGKKHVKKHRRQKLPEGTSKIQSDKQETASSDSIDSSSKDCDDLKKDEDKTRRHKPKAGMIKGAVKNDQVPDQNNEPLFGDFKPSNKCHNDEDTKHLPSNVVSPEKKSSGTDSNSVPCPDESDVCSTPEVVQNLDISEDENQDSTDTKPDPPLIDILDEDDYLLYLEEVLLTVHKAYYQMLDEMVGQEMKNIPDLKNVIPYVRRKVLKGVNIVFSGVIPTNMPPHKSRLWMTAKSLGANVSQDLVLSGDEQNCTTHVIAAKLGTAKLNKAKRIGSIHVVSPDWLICCSERWEHADERLFPLTKDTVFKNPFPKEPYDVQRKEYSDDAGDRSDVTISTNNSSHPGKDYYFSESSTDAFSYNPMLAFSAQDLADMGNEVDITCNETSNGADSLDSDDSAPDNTEGNGRKRKNSDESDTSSEESLTGGECPRGWKKIKKSAPHAQAKYPGFGGIYESEDDEVTRYPRWEHPHLSELSDVNSSDSDDFRESIGSIDEEMVAAIERELADC